MRDELAQQRVAVDDVALAQDLHVHLVGLGRAEAEDGAHAGDDDHVAAGEQRGGGGVPEAVDLLVDRRVLLDVEVARRDVRLGLVVVVVGDEVLDRVVGEERAELVAELGGERLVVRQHERRALQLLDDAGHRHRLAGAGRAEQRREAIAARDGSRDLPDRLGLIGGRREDVLELELRHGRRSTIAAVAARRCPLSARQAWIASRMRCAVSCERSRDGAGSCFDRQRRSDHDAHLRPAPRLVQRAGAVEVHRHARSRRRDGRCGPTPDFAGHPVGVHAALGEDARSPGPRSRTVAAVSNASVSQTPRWTGNAPSRFSSPPQRPPNSSLLAMNRIRRRSASATNSASRFEGWLDAAM